MSPADLDEVRNRIGRLLQAVQHAAGDSYETSYKATGADFLTHFRVIGVKAPEQLQDDFLNLFVWTWSLKDYIKEYCKVKGLSMQKIEDVANKSKSLQYVADIANRAKHGTLRESRSGEFAELVGVGFNIPQESIARISCAGPEVVLHVEENKLIQILATVRTNQGKEFDALVVLKDAIGTWENQAFEIVQLNRS